MCGQNMTLPVDLEYGARENPCASETQFVCDLSKKLKEIHKTVAPWNQQKDSVTTNPFQVGDQILILQQPMERDHKFTPRWRGPYEVVGITNAFQLRYMDEGRTKITHIRNCKKFKGPVKPGNVVPEGEPATTPQYRVRCKRGRMNNYVIQVTQS